MLVARRGARALCHAARFQPDSQTPAPRAEPPEPRPGRQHQRSSTGGGLGARGRFLSGWIFGYAQANNRKHR
eukprot:14675756-Alexandrium_andersonii.AAC.1